jgi:hypothetical protein
LLVVTVLARRYDLLRFAHDRLQRRAGLVLGNVLDYFSG